MPDQPHDLKALEESIRRDAERVEELENRKSGLDPGDPSVGQASRQVERIATDLGRKAVAERRLTEDS